MDTKTLDQRIRERASAELEKDINEAFLGAEVLADRFMYHNVPGLTARVNMAIDPTPVNFRTALTLIKDAIFEHYREERQEAYVQAFIAKVDSMQREIDELWGEYAAV